MRNARLTRPEVVAIYSICAKVVDDLFKFVSEDTKETICKILWDVADFCGVEILDFALMSNHYHIEARVLPKKTHVPDEKVVERVGILYGEETGQALGQAVDNLRELGDEKGLEALLAPYRARMNDLSQFMKTFVQRVTMTYNRENHRNGTLWKGRFHSTLLEYSSLELARRVAAYMDLNPLRAGMIDVIEKYPWCGYGLACIPGKRGERGRQCLALLYPGDTPEVFLEKHRKLLLARFAKKGMNQKKKEVGRDDLDFSERQPALIHAKVIGSMAFVLRALGKLPKRGVRSLADGYVAVGGERKRTA